MKEKKQPDVEQNDSPASRRVRCISPNPILLRGYGRWEYGQEGELPESVAAAHPGRFEIKE